MLWTKKIRSIGILSDWSTHTATNRAKYPWLRCCYCFIRCLRRDNCCYCWLWVFLESPSCRLHVSPPHLLCLATPWYMLGMMTTFSHFLKPIPLLTSLEEDSSVDAIRQRAISRSSFLDEDEKRGARYDWRVSVTWEPRSKVFNGLKRKKYCRNDQLYGFENTMDPCCGGSFPPFVCSKGFQMPTPAPRAV